MKEIFKRLIKDFYETSIKTFPREINIPLDTNKIISLVGIRRSGKSYLLFDLINKLRKKRLGENIIYINFEDDRLIGISVKDLEGLIEAYFELFPKKREEKIYIFLDEIQIVPDWEKFVRRVYDTLNCNIFITGSSSKLMSKEIATSLRGRSITYEIFPLTFYEYLNFKKVKVDVYSSKNLSFIKSFFYSYIKEGGFPEIALEKSKDVKTRILRDYVDLIVYRDIIERYKIKNLNLLKFLIKYIFSNPATLCSFNKLYNNLKSMGYKVSKDTLFDYFEYLNEAYAAFLVPIFKSSIKEEMRNPKKIYIADNGFNLIFDSSFSENFSKLYENLVFLHLRRKYKEIYYFKKNKEVDFFISGNKLLINVSYEINDQETLRREIKSLVEAMEFLKIEKALLITSETERVYKTENYQIIIKPLWKYLLNI